MIDELLQKLFLGIVLYLWDDIREDFDCELIIGCVILYLSIKDLLIESKRNRIDL